MKRIFREHLPGLAVALAMLGACQPPAPPRTVGSVEVSPGLSVLDDQGASLLLQAEVRDTQGVVWSDAEVQWTSSDPSVAEVNARGEVVSGVPGVAEISATAGELSGVAQIQVMVQPNPACGAGALPLPGEVLPLPVFGDTPELQPQLPASSWDGQMHVVVDFDGDGDEDVLRMEYSFPSSATYSGELNLFENVAGGLVVTTDTRLAAPVIPDHPRDYEVFDTDGDGRAEIFVAQHGFDAAPFPGAPNLLLSWGGSALADVGPNTLTPFAQDGFSHGTSTADVDCDGDLDLYVANVNDNEPVHLFLNDGGGQFEAEDSLLPGVLRNGVWQEVAFIDFDRDGDPDLFAGTAAHSAVMRDLLLVNDGFGRFRESSQAQLPPARYVPTHAVNTARVADFTGDGWDDLVLFEIPQPFSAVSSIRLWANQQDGTFEDVSVAWGLPEECTGELVEPLFVDDWNGDGWPDFSIPYGCTSLGTTGLFINRGGTFEFLSMASLESWLNYDAPHPLDLDGDGDRDLYLPHHPEPAILRNLSP